MRFAAKASNSKTLAVWLDKETRKTFSGHLETSFNETFVEYCVFRNCLNNCRHLGSNRDASLTCLICTQK